MNDAKQHFFIRKLGELWLQWQSSNEHQKPSAGEGQGKVKGGSIMRFTSTINVLMKRKSQYYRI